MRGYLLATFGISHCIHLHNTTVIVEKKRKKNPRRMTKIPFPHHYESLAKIPCLPMLATIDFHVAYYTSLNHLPPMESSSVVPSFANRLLKGMIAFLRTKCDMATRKIHIIVC